jgi:hypothetical protein
MGELAHHGYRCPCCGYFGLGLPPFERLLDPSLAQGLKPPYGAYFGSASYEICECCGFEYGYDDEPGSGAGLSFEEYLKEWINAGCQWFTLGRRPNGWDLDEQLTQAGLTRPHDS